LVYSFTSLLARQSFDLVSSLVISDGYCNFSFELNHGNYNLSIDDEDKSIALCFHDSCFFLEYGNSQTFSQHPFGPFGIWICFHDELAFPFCAG
jgi:hypothetical protein